MAWIFRFVVLLYVINKNEIPEFKMPWLIIFFLLPVIGSFVYMLLSTTSTSKKEYLRFQKADDEMKPFVKQSKRIDLLIETDEDAWLQANHLYTQMGMSACGNTNTVYYPLGENFHAALPEELKKAEKFIFMEYFIVQEGAMWDPIHAILKEKAASGVEVYFLYDDFGCFATLPLHYHKQQHSYPVRKRSRTYL